MADIFKIFQSNNANMAHFGSNFDNNSLGTIIAKGELKIN